MFPSLKISWDSLLCGRISLIVSLSGFLVLTGYFANVLYWARMCLNPEGQKKVFWVSSCCDSTSVSLP